jgi:uncharacterized protein YbjQ (UPF0145 family)
MDQDSKEEIPSFQLPEWGTEGAPPPPPPEAPEIEPDGPTVTVEVDHSLLMFTGPVPPAWQIESVLGVVTGEGVSDKTRPSKAVSSARTTAMQQLESAARALGVNAVGGVALALTAKKSFTAVIAYGTALRVIRT